MSDEVIPVLPLFQAREGHLGARDVLYAGAVAGQPCVRSVHVYPHAFLGFSTEPHAVCHTSEHRGVRVTVWKECTKVRKQRVLVPARGVSPHLRTLHPMLLTK